MGSLQCDETLPAQEVGKEQGLPYLVKQLLASGVRLNGELQLCIHGGHTHTDLGWY